LDLNPKAFSYMYFIVSLWSWDRSCAHFNFAITIGEAFCNLGSVKSSWTKYFLIFVAQFFGSLLGVFITFISSKTTHTDTSKTLFPAVPVLCPTITGNSGGSCVNGEIIQTTLKYELFASFIYIFGWLVIRRLPLE
jgi:glycerol uptake facilitator-like aquaporin